MPQQVGRTLFGYKNESAGWMITSCVNDNFVVDAAPTNVIPVTMEEYNLSKVIHPFNSRLYKSKPVEDGFELLSTWPDALTRYLKEIEY